MERKISSGIKKASCIFVIALIFRLTPFVFYLPKGENRIFEPDSYGYNTLAINLLKNHAFSRDIEAPYNPECFITPLYPMYLALIYRFFGINPKVAVLFQVLIGSLSPILLFKIGKVLNIEKAGFIGALLLAFDLPSIYFANVLLTETLFTFLLLFSIYSLFSFFQFFRTKDVIIAGLVFGLSSLRHNICLYYLIFILPFFFFLPLPKKKIWEPLLLFILSFFLILSPWVIRNYKTFGSFQISNANDHVLLFWNVTMLKSEREGITFEEAREELKKEADKKITKDIGSNPFLEARIYRRIALQEMRKSPLLYLKLHLIIGPRNLFDEFGIDILFNYFGEKLPPWVKEVIVKKQFGKVFAEYPLWVILTFILEGYLLIIYIFSLIGSYYFLKKNKFTLYFILFLIVSFILAVGPVAYIRYRVPIIPYIYLLSGSGIIFIIEYIRSKWPKGIKS